MSSNQGPGGVPGGPLYQPPSLPTSQQHAIIHTNPLRPQYVSQPVDPDLPEALNQVLKKRGMTPADTGRVKYRALVQRKQTIYVEVWAHDSKEAKKIIQLLWQGGKLPDSWTEDASGIRVIHLDTKD